MPFLGVVSYIKGFFGWRVAKVAKVAKITFPPFFRAGWLLLVYRSDMSQQGQQPIVYVQQKNSSGCMVAFWILLGLIVLSVGGCFLVGGAGCAAIQSSVDQAERERLERKEQEEQEKKEAGEAPADDDGEKVEDGEAEKAEEPS